MITVNVSGQDADYSGLSWSASDPGGFETCNFVVERNNVTSISPNDPVTVYDGLEIAWQGVVEEPGLRSDGKKETYNVACVGYGIHLKRNPYSMVYIDRNLSEWKAQPLQRDIFLAPLGFIPGGSWIVTSGESSDGKPSLVLAFDDLNNTTVPTPDHISVVEIWYDAGAGNTIAYSKYDFETWDTAGHNLLTSVTWFKQVQYSDDETNGVETQTQTAGVATNQTFTATTPRRYAMLTFYFNATAAGVGNWKWIVENFRLVGPHGLPLQGTSPTGDGFYPSDIVVDAVRRSRAHFDLFVEDSTGYTLPHCVYRTKTAADTIVDDMSKFVGWHWGVWEPISTFSNNPAFYFVPPPPAPTAVVHYDDCQAVDITEKLSEMFNTALVNFILPNGAVGNVTVTKPHPRLPDDVIQTVTLDVGTVGSDAAATAIGTYQLALLQDTARTAGSMTLPNTLIGGRAAHMLRPGRDKIRLLGLPTFDKLLLDSSSGVESFRVRRISVSVDGGIPRTQIEFDHGADLIEVLQARLANAAEASNLG